jgi:hypothetical protein
MRNGELLEAIEIYLDAIFYCDTVKLDEVFHPESSLFDSDQGAIFVDPIASFRQDVATRSSPASADQKREEEVILIDFLSSTNALVKLRLRAHNNVFVDYLNFILDRDNKWKIVAKIWHLEKTIESM